MVCITFRLLEYVLFCISGSFLEPSVGKARLNVRRVDVFLVALAESISHQHVRFIVPCRGKRRSIPEQQIRRTVL